MNFQFLDQFKDFAALTVGLGIFTSVALLFRRAEEEVTPAFKAALGRWLTELSIPVDRLHWPRSFARLFDAVFGRKHFTVSCFLRSCQFSLISIALLTGVWAAIDPKGFDSFVRNVELVDLYMILVIIVVFNLFPDYLSLLQTRLLLRMLERRASALRVMAFLFLDTTLSAGIYALFLFAFLFDAPDTGQPVRWDALIARMEAGLLFRSLNPWEIPLGVFVYSTFFTSVWLWLHAAAQSLLALLRQVDLGLRAIRFVLPVKDHPVRAIGYVTALLGMLGYWLIVAIGSLVSGAAATIPP